MTMLNLTTIELRRGTLAAFAVCGLIIAASQGLSVRAQAEDATPDYVAPLDMTSTYAGPFEAPDFLPDELARRAMAAPDTTGVNSTPPAPGGKRAAAPQQDETNMYPDDIYKFAP